MKISTQHSLYIAIFALSTLLQTRAARCPDCDVKYANCAWNCYTSGGWKPQCVHFVTAKEQALGTEIDPTSNTVSSSECDAECYVNELGDLNQYVDYAVQYPEAASPANSNCEELWRQKQVLEYQMLKEGPYPELVEPMPAWMEEEAKKMDENPVDATQIYLAWDSCLICGEKTGTAPVPAPSGSSPTIVLPKSPSPAPAPSPPPPTLTASPPVPATLAPAPEEPIIPPVPAPVQPESAPAPAPADGSASVDGISPASDAAALLLKTSVYAVLAAIFVLAVML